MSAAEQTRTVTRRSDLAGAGAAALFALLLGLPSLLYPFHPDHGMFAYVADRWLHGALPYRDAWDIKPPGIFAVYALAQAVFGRGMMAARLADLLATMLAAVLLYALARRRFGPRGALVAPFVFAALYFTCFDFQDSAQSESFAAPLCVLYLLCLLRWREHGGWGAPLAAGLALGAAALLKTAFALYAFLALPVLLASLRAGRDRRGLAAGAACLAAGFAALPALALAYFAAHGALPELRELLAAQRAYATLPNGEALGRAFRCTVRFWRQRPALDVAVALALATALPGFWRTRAGQPEALAWLALAAGMVAIEWRGHGYYFLVLLPPVALLAGGLLAHAWRSLSAHLEARTAATACLTALLLAPVAGDAARFGMASRLLTGALSREQYLACFAAPGWYPFSSSEAAARYVREHTAPGETVLVFDYDPTIYYLSGRICPTRHLSTEPIFSNEYYPPALQRQWKEQQERETSAHPPRLLVVGMWPDDCGLSTRHDYAPPALQYAGCAWSYRGHITKYRIYERE